MCLPESVEVTAALAERFEQRASLRVIAWVFTIAAARTSLLYHQTTPITWTRKLVVQHSIVSNIPTRDTRTESTVTATVEA